MSKKADVIKRAPFDAEASVNGNSIKELARERAFDRADDGAKIIKTLRDLTSSAITVKNYPVQEFKALSAEPSDWGVSYYFPVAKDESGKTVPTFVDAPENKRQTALCQKKAAVMEKLGRRYLVFKQENLITADMLNATIQASSETMINEGHIVSL